MVAGPSPVIPFLVVGALAVFIYRSDVVEAVSSIFDLEEPVVCLVLLLGVLLVSLVQLASEIIIIPLVFVLVVIVLKYVIIGPLVLLLVIHLIAKYYRPSDELMRRWGGESRQGSGDEGEGIGFGGFMLALLFVIMYPMLYDGEGYGWVPLVVVFGFFLFFSAS